MQHKPSERNRELALYSRLPSAKRAFITRWIGRVKPIKEDGGGSIPTSGKRIALPETPEVIKGQRILDFLRRVAKRTFCRPN
jgi:hypothetical protein